MTKRRVKFEPLQEPKGLRHPSGKPLRRGKYGIETSVRRVREEPLSPGLQRRTQTYAVGFTADLGDEYED